MKKFLLSIFVVLIISHVFTAASIQKPNDELLFPIFGYEHGGSYGFINSAGKIVITPQFSWVNHYSEGLAAVKKNNKWGYIDQTGKIIIPLIYDDAEDFSEGLGLVKMGDSWSYLNTQGKEIFKQKFSWAKPFSEGLALVIPEGSTTVSMYIDKTGKAVLTPSQTCDFEWDKLSKEDRELLQGQDNTFIKKYLDKQGKEHLTMPAYYGMFENGLAKFTCGSEGLYAKQGYINKAGKIVWDPIHSSYAFPTGP